MGSKREVGLCRALELSKTRKCFKHKNDEVRQVRKLLP